MSVEQAIGQVLLHLQELQDAVASLERRVYRWPPEEDDNQKEKPS